MNTAACKNVDSRSWKDLYQAAISESNLTKLPERIAEAEAALVMRGRDLFYPAGDDGEDAGTVDDAMCILRDLRSSLKRNPPAV